MTEFSRREFFRQSVACAGLSVLGSVSGPAIAHGTDRRILPVAGIATVYRRNSHADVILGKILEGYDQQGGPGPALKLVSLYVDQFPENDLSRDLAKKYKVPIFKTIEEALTVGGSDIRVAGVLSIGEHGNYPFTPDTNQRMYPRRRFFDEIVATFKKHEKVVPVFSDKHLAYNWEDAKHMYDTAKRMTIPFMAGSSVPVMWRKPSITVPLDCEIEEVIGLGYGGHEGYGFHTLEGMQCIVERRKGGETGIKSVQAVLGEEIWKAEEAGRWSRDLLLAAVAVQPYSTKGTLEARVGDKSPFYLIEYEDGLRVTITMASSLGHNFGCAVKLKGKKEPVAFAYMHEDGRPYGHFTYLLAAIEHMVHTGEAAYPVERTLLTTGALDRAMHSLADDNRRYDTPELKIAYKANKWPFAKTAIGVPPKD